MGSNGLKTKSIGTIRLFYRYSNSTNKHRVLEYLNIINQRGKYVFIYVFALLK